VASAVIEPDSFIMGFLLASEFVDRLARLTTRKRAPSTSTSAGRGREL
jgi:hypothetical protein